MNGCVRSCRNHDWGSADAGSIPLPILEKDLKNNNIRISAAEMHTFVRHFGILVGDLIPHEDLAWKIYIHLRKILTLLMSIPI